MGSSLRWAFILLVALGPVPGIPGMDQLVEALGSRPVPRLVRSGAVPAVAGPAEPVLQPQPPDQRPLDGSPPHPAFLITDPATVLATWSPARTSWSLASHRRAHSDGQPLLPADAAGWPSAHLALVAALSLGAPRLLAIGLRRVTPLRGPPVGVAPLAD